jgi:hypothetical protein
LASRVADEAAKLGADAIFVDEGGVGGGVVDRLRQLRHRCFGIQFGSKSDRPVVDARFANKRAEMYGHLRAWLAGGAIETIPRLKDELIAVEYCFNLRDEIQLERKEDLKRRLPSIGSPDWADSLALTFAYEVACAPDSGGLDNAARTHVNHEYDPFASERIFAEMEDA